ARRAFAGQQPQLRDRERPFLQDLQQRLTDQAGGTNNGNVHGVMHLESSGRTLDGSEAYRLRRRGTAVESSARYAWRDGTDVAAPRATPERLVHEHQRDHRLADRRGADADAGVVASGGDDLHWISLHIEARHRQAEAGGGLEGHRAMQGLAGADPAKDSSGMVGAEAVGSDGVP